MSSSFSPDGFYRVPVPLSTLPPEATLRDAQVPNGPPVHIADVLRDTVVVISADDFTDRATQMQAAKQIAACLGASTVALTHHRVNEGQFFRDIAMYAKMVGGASAVYVPSPALVTYLDLRCSDDRICNDILIVKNGTVIWSSTSDSRRPRTPHDINGFKNAIARLQAKTHEQAAN